MSLYLNCNTTKQQMGWWVLLVAFMNVVLLGGQRRTFAVITSALRQDFSNETTTRTELNWIGVSYTAVNFLLMPLITNCILIARRQYRIFMLSAAIVSFLALFASSYVPSPTYLFLTSSLIHGLGSTVILSCAALIVGEYFDKNHPRHVLATTLISGGAYGTLIFGSMYGALVHLYGWRITLRVLAATVFGVASVGALVFVRNNEKLSPSDKKSSAPLLSSNEKSTSTSQEAANSWMKRSLWVIIPWDHLKKNHQIVIWIFERIIFNIIMYSFIMNLVDLMVDQMKMRIDYASSITVVNGIGESIACTLGALFGDHFKGKLVNGHLVCSAIVIVLIAGIIYLYESATCTFAIVLCLGFCLGAGNVCLYAVSSEVMRIHGSISYSATRMVASIGILLAPIFSGFVIQHYGYRIFFICQAILACVRFTLLFSIFLLLPAEEDNSSFKKTVEIDPEECTKVTLDNEDTDSSDSTALLKTTK